jgi:hypothetical protein
LVDGVFRFHISFFIFVPGFSFLRIYLSLVLFFLSLNSSSETNDFFSFLFLPSSDNVCAGVVILRVPGTTHNSQLNTSMIVTQVYLIDWMT